MKQFNIFIYDLYLEERLNPITGIAIVETKEDAVKEFELNYKNIIHYEYKNRINWEEFKSLFHIYLPQKYRYKVNDWFENEEFYQICQLSLQILTNFMKNELGKTNFFNLNLN